MTFHTTQNCWYASSSTYPCIGAKENADFLIGLQKPIIGISLSNPKTVHNVSGVRTRCLIVESDYYTLCSHPEQFKLNLAHILSCCTWPTSQVRIDDIIQMWRDKIIQRNLRLHYPPFSQCTVCTSSIPRVSVKSIMHDHTKVNFLKISFTCAAQPFFVRVLSIPKFVPSNHNNCLNVTFSLLKGGSAHLIQL